MFGIEVLELDPKNFDEAYGLEGCKKLVKLYSPKRAFSNRILHSRRDEKLPLRGKYRKPIRQSVSTQGKEQSQKIYFFVPQSHHIAMFKEAEVYARLKNLSQSSRMGIVTSFLPLAYRRTNIFKNTRTKLCWSRFWLTEFDYKRYGFAEQWTPLYAGSCHRCRDTCPEGRRSIDDATEAVTYQKTVDCVCS